MASIQSPGWVNGLSDVDSLDLDPSSLANIINILLSSLDLQNSICPVVSLFVLSSAVTMSFNLEGS